MHYKKLLSTLFMTLVISSCTAPTTKTPPLKFTTTENCPSGLSVKLKNISIVDGIVLAKVMMTRHPHPSCQCRSRLLSYSVSAFWPAPPDAQEPNSKTILGSKEALQSGTIALGEKTEEKILVLATESSQFFVTSKGRDNTITVEFSCTPSL